MRDEKGEGLLRNLAYAGSLAFSVDELALLRAEVKCDKRRVMVVSEAQER